MKGKLLSSFRCFQRTFQRLHNSSPNYNSDHLHQIMRGTMPTIWTNPVWTEALNESHRKMAKSRRNVISESFPASHDCVIARLRKSRDCSEHLVKFFKRLLKGTDNEISWPGHASLMFATAVRDSYPNADFLSKAEEPVQYMKQIQMTEALNWMHNVYLFSHEDMRTSITHDRIATKSVQIVSNFFTSEALRKIGSLKHPQVTWLLGSILESSATTRWNTKSGNCLRTLEDWEQTCFHQTGSIVANGCQASLTLANHSGKLNELGFQFGRLLTLAIKAHCEIQKFIDYDKSVTSSYELTLLPVVLHIDKNPEILVYIYGCGEPMSNIELQEMYEIMKPTAIKDAKKQLSAYMNSLNAILQEFKKSDSAQNLLSLIGTLNKFDETS